MNWDNAIEVALLWIYSEKNICSNIIFNGLIVFPVCGWIYLLPEHQGWVASILNSSKLKWIFFLLLNKSFTILGGKVGY